MWDGEGRVANGMKARFLCHTQPLESKEGLGASRGYPWGRGPKLLTSQSLQTSSKDLKARWKQRQNQGNSDCSAPAPLPSVGRAAETGQGQGQAGTCEAGWQWGVSGEGEVQGATVRLLPRPWRWLGITFNSGPILLSHDLSSLAQAA